MTPRRFIFGTGRAGELWPVLLLLVVVVVPTLGVLWFVGVAMNNEQLAARQKLADAYRAHLLSVQRGLDDYWRAAAAAESAAAEDSAEGVSPRDRFAAAVRSGVVDAVVCYDADGMLLYPQPPPVSPPERHENEPRWREAERIEFEMDRPTEAALIYESIGRQAEESDKNQRARALQAQVRCLLKSSRTEEAIELVLDLFADKQLADAVDIHGRLIGPNVDLMALEQLHAAGRVEDKGGDAAGDEAHDQLAMRLATRLTDRLNDYRDESLSSSQRLFLMKQLQRLSPDGATALPTLNAEQLAADFVAAHPRPARSSTWLRSQLPDVWQYATPDGRTLLLLETDRLAALSLAQTVGDASPSEAQVKLLPPQEAEQRPALMSIAAGRSLPGWRLSLSLLDDRQFNDAVSRRNTLYLWIGGLVVLSTSLLALFLARAFRRQLHAARLKNDLVGTVSHELKTPLASMRVLVDTLLDAEGFDERQVREYLQLIAKENARLSRLIDNFLTFSRMEQGRQLFAMQRVAPVDVVQRAVEAAGERFQQPDCRLTIEIDEDLPAVVADSDALVTAVLNLLDNAYKFSQPPREIALRAVQDKGRVLLQVSDNGVGLSRIAARKVFEQFYQVDQRLNRLGQGCGLGLSIVHYIVRAHGGEVRVESQSGRGAVFIIELPAQGTKSPAVQEALT